MNVAEIKSGDDSTARLIKLRKDILSLCDKAFWDLKKGQSEKITNAVSDAIASVCFYSGIYMHVEKKYGVCSDYDNLEINAFIANFVHIVAAELEDDCPSFFKFPELEILDEPAS